MQQPSRAAIPRPGVSGFSCAISVLATQNFATRLAAIRTVWPIAGIRPSRADSHGR